MAKAQKADSAPDAIALLKEDHANVKEAFKEFEKIDSSDTATLQELVTTVCGELKVHAAIEEEIFYPAVRAVIDDEDLMNEAQVEHQSAKDLIYQLEGMKATDALFAATFTVLSEYVNHHVAEEESEMFPKVRKLRIDLASLGRKMAERKSELMSEEADASS